MGGTTWAPDTLRGTHSPQIAQQFQASGVAQVIVVLKRAQTAAAGGAGAAVGGGGEGELAQLRRHFVTSELSHDSAVLGAVAAGAGLRVMRGRRAAPEAPAVRMYRNLGVMLGNVTPESLVGLRNENDVASVTGAPILTLIRPRKIADAKLQTQAQWGINALGVPRLWEAGIDGRGVVVAHLDTGVDGTHPALKGAIASFAEFDALGNQVMPSPKPHDSGQHGTHTAGTIAGRAVRGVSIGVAPGAKLASAMVIEGGNVVARVLAGLDWALGRQAKVLSMSLGLTGWWDDFLPVIQILRARGVLPVIAVGNEGPGTSRSPGNYAESLSVGAVDKNLDVADFSSSQRFARPKDPNVPDLVGPGVDVTSSVPGRRYAMMSGTSMATPHIAGLAALLFQAKPGASLDDVENAILRSCTRGPGMPAARAGEGFPNAAKAYENLTGTVLAARPKAAKPPKGSGRKKSAKKKASRNKPAARKTGKR